MKRSTVNCHFSTASSLRFRRWSRKGYAAFASVRRAVTIGRLTSNIIERFQKKNLSLHTGICMSMEGVFGADEEEEYTDCLGNETGVSLAGWQSLALLSVQASNEIAHPAGYTYIIYFIRGGMYLRIRSTFFYFHLIII